MTLLEVVQTLGSLDRKCTIYAAAPWTESSDAVVAVEPESGGLPSEAERLGLKYFLEIFIAKDFLEDWAAQLGTVPSAREKCTRLIQYAVNDC